jgi:hypothetical protein
MLDSNPRGLLTQPTGPAGGSWSSGTVCEEIVMDAANFCLIVCGRPGRTVANLGLLATQMPF